MKPERLGPTFDSGLGPTFAKRMILLSEADGDGVAIPAGFEPVTLWQASSIGKQLIDIHASAWGCDLSCAPRSTRLSNQPRLDCLCADHPPDPAQLPKRSPVPLAPGSISARRRAA